jgi:hypothetical protein
MSIPLIRINGLHKCYLPNIREKEEYTYKTTLINVYSKNEIDIGEKFKKYNFHIFEKYESFKISYADSEDILDMDKEKYQSEFVNKYYAVLFTYKKEIVLPFYSLFLSKHNCHHLLSSLFQTYFSFIRKLLFFREVGIYYLLSVDNLFFEVFGETPYFSNFSLSVDISKPFADKIHLLRDIGTKDKIPSSILHWELHLLFYLFRYSGDTVFTEKMRDEIMNDYIQHIQLPSFVSKNYWMKWKEIYISSITRYIDCNITDILQHILINIDCWDIFSLHCLYIHLFTNFYKLYYGFFSPILKSFFKEWFSLLYEVIHPEKKRVDLSLIYTKATECVEKVAWDKINLFHESIRIDIASIYTLEDLHP